MATDKNTFETRKAERRAQNTANDSLADLSRLYHDGIPVGKIADILSANGFDPEAVDGIYTGREGRSHEQVGPKTWIAISWFKMAVTGRYEVTAYVS